MVLSILTIAALGSIATFTVMLSLKSLNKTLLMEELQKNAQQILNHENNDRISNYFANPFPLTRADSSIILADGIAYTYRQFPGLIERIGWPPPGFSLQSNYASTLIRFQSQVTLDLIQTPVLSTGISCIDVATKTLSRIPEIRYSLVFNHQTDNPVHYAFYPDRGEIRKNTASTSGLLIDLDNKSHQAFSRAEFAILKTNEITRLAIIFAVISSKNAPADAQNKLYVLFDDGWLNHAFATQQPDRPLSIEELTHLTHDYEPTGLEKGFVISLDPGYLETSAITTVDSRIIFIAQWPQINVKSNNNIFKNELYQISLTQNSGKIIEIRLLPDSKQLLELTTRLTQQSVIVIATQANSALLEIPVNCKQVFQYEE